MNGWVGCWVGGWMSEMMGRKDEWEQQVRDWVG